MLAGKRAQLEPEKHPPHMGELKTHIAIFYYLKHVDNQEDAGNYAL